MLDVDSGELSRETDRDGLREKRARVPWNDGPQPRRLLTRQRSGNENINHFAAETYLISRLTFTLLRNFRVGYRWISRFLALVCYALLLMPGFLQVAYHYFSSKQVKRSVIYGNMPRNRMDLYLPANIREPKPVLIFVTGGAWIIGFSNVTTIAEMIDSEIRCLIPDWNPNETPTAYVWIASSIEAYITSNMCHLPFPTSYRYIYTTL